MWNYTLLSDADKMNILLNRLAHLEQEHFGLYVRLTEMTDPMPLYFTSEEQSEHDAIRQRMVKIETRINALTSFRDTLTGERTYNQMEN